MKKKTDLRVGQHVSQHLRQHGEVVVMHPDKIAVPVHVLDGVCKTLVHGLLTQRREKKNRNRRGEAGVALRWGWAGNERKRNNIEIG